MTRVALFGLLGSGNIGNEGSAEAVLRYLAERHPDVEVSAICAGPDDVHRRYGVPAVSMTWARLDRSPGSGVRRLGAKVVAKVADPWRTYRLVRRVDLVVVPGMGVLEDSLPLHPWGFPLALLGLTAAGRAAGTPVALVGVGATRAHNPVTRHLLRWAARGATYRSYRDAGSRAAVADLGVDTTADPVYPDLAFALPLPAGEPGASDRRAVALGVLAWRGRQEDHARAEGLLTEYTEQIVELARRLVVTGWSVRLVTGDPDDRTVAAEVQRRVAGVLFEEPTTLTELVRQLAGVDVVVASRYHNVLCALRAGKPTISLGYARKNAELLEQMGLGTFARDIGSIDVDEVVALCEKAFGERQRLGQALTARDAEVRQNLDAQWDDLDHLLAAVERSNRGDCVSTAGGPQ
jgi:polysaccharide pyruvyl transferase WcaK-like protein